MPRPEKVRAVAEIKERMERAHALFLAEYAGLSVKEQQQLRRELKSNDAEFKVVKMTLARRAAAELAIDALDPLLLGPTGLAFADGDPVGAAKALNDFARAHDVFTIKGGLLGGELLTPERVAELAAIESREILLARLAGVFQAPAARAARLFSALPRSLAVAMQQLLEERQQGAGPAPVADVVANVEDAAAGTGAAEADASASDPETTNEIPGDAGEDETADAAEEE